MIKPAKVTLAARTRLDATVRVEGTELPAPIVGTIHVECSTAQAFAEILNYLVHAEESIIAVQTAILALQMAKGPADRRPDLRKLQDIHWRLTGWHFLSTDTPSPLDNASLETDLRPLEGKG